MIFLLLLLISPVLLFLTHVVLSHATSDCRINISSLLVVLLSILVCLGLILAMGWQVHLRYLVHPREIFCGAGYAAIVTCCFSYAYVHLFMMGETARRLHILYELQNHGSMTHAQLMEIYGASTMLSARLQRLLESHQLALKDNRYILRKTFLYRVSTVLMGWGRMLGFRAEALE